MHTVVVVILAILAGSLASLITAILPIGVRERTELLRLEGLPVLPLKWTEWSNSTARVVCSFSLPTLRSPLSVRPE
jgi:hypothetical protein